MDSLRGFDTQDAVLAPPLDDAAVEAPPEIGTDERRMHVRAYNFWAQMLADRSYPSIDDLDLTNLSDFGPNAVLLDFTAGLDNPSINYIGEALRDECGLDADITSIAQVPSRSLLSRLTDHYLQIIANQAPIGFEAEYENDRGAQIMYRGILLPFSSDDDSIDFILGVINWKETVASVVADALVLEVEQAVRHAPPVAAAPVWADGPMSDSAAGAFADYLHRDAADARAMDYAGDDAGDAVVDTVLDHDAGLADFLASARQLASMANQNESRGRQALYQAIGRAHDFALASRALPDDYAELLADTGIKAQPRAPMTPIVKLVFGADYDKTRLAEYALVLDHAQAQEMPAGELTPYLAAYQGGLKQLVRDVRAHRRGERPTPDHVPTEGAHTAYFRSAVPRAFVEIDADADFVVLVARRVADGQFAVVGHSANAPLVDKVMRAAAS